MSETGRQPDPTSTPPEARAAAAPGHPPDDGATSAPAASGADEPGAGAPAAASASDGADGGAPPEAPGGGGGAPPAAGPSLWTRVRHRLAEMFGLDLRSLAFMRVALGLLILRDLWIRSSAMRAHYTDWGLMPRELLLDKASADWRFSFHLFAGEVELVWVLFAIQALFGVLLMVGYRARLMTVLSWLMMLSLQNRNPIILNAGDTLFRLWLFWAMFLPLGARYSVDAALDKERWQGEVSEPNRYVSVASFAMILQLLFTYWFPVFAFRRGQRSRLWEEGGVLNAVLGLDEYVTVAGRWLTELGPAILQGMSQGVYYWEMLGTFLVFAPLLHGPLRTLAVAGFSAMHAGFYLFLQVGIFPLVSITAWCALIPGWLWDRLDRWRGVLGRPARAQLRVYYAMKPGLVWRMARLLKTFLILPRAAFVSTEEDPQVAGRLAAAGRSWLVVDHEGRVYEGFDAIVYLMRISSVGWPLGMVWGWTPLRKLGRWLYGRLAGSRRARGLLEGALRPARVRVRRGWVYAIALNLAAAFFLLYISAWNMRTTNFKLWEPYFSRDWNDLGNALRIGQKWDMFSPGPPTRGGWFVIDATLINGKRVDLLRDGAPFSWERPEHFLDYVPNRRWGKFLSNIKSKNYKQYRLEFGRYLTRDWNEYHDYGHQLVEFKFYYIRADVLDDGSLSMRPILLWHHHTITPRKPNPERPQARAN